MSRNDALIGGWFAASDPAGWTAFSEKYRRTFGTPAPRLATLSYDAMSMAMALTSKAVGERYTAENLTRPQGFSGVDGVVRLTPGGLSSRGLAVLEIGKYRSVVIDAAPQTAPQALATPVEPRVNL